MLATTASGYPHEVKKDNKKPFFINSRNYVYHATGDHICFMDDGEKKTKDITIGDKVKSVSLPNSVESTKVPLEEAEMWGMLVADGYFDKDGCHAKFVKKDDSIRDRFRYLWESVTGKGTKESESRSGFNPNKKVKYLGLNSSKDYLRDLDLYTSLREKRVPKKILNASKETKLAFLKGYNNCDGLKKNSCTYKFKNFKTNSATLAQGLYYLASLVLPSQEMNITVEQKKDEPDKIYYSINLLSPKNDNVSKILDWHKEGVSRREIARGLGIKSRKRIREITNGTYAPKEHHLKKCSNEVKKIMEMAHYEGWYCDLETSSGEFVAGVGSGHVHNSPRRGETFVTRKITKAISAIKAGKQDCLYMGNLDAKRDWGYAKDYVEGMWRMLQVDIPDDYVLATGEMHTVREFIEKSVQYVDIPIKWEGSGEEEHARDMSTGNIIVKIDPKYYRPAEVEQLLGDPTKAKEKLGWKPKVTFEELVKIMMKHDMDNL